MNLVLGAVAVTLAAAIAGVLFIGTGDAADSSSQPTPGITSASTTTTTPPGQTASSASQAEPTTQAPRSVDEFVMPEQLDGRWNADDGSSIAQFTSGTLESWQSAITVDGESVAVVLVEPSTLGGIPTEVQPVQAVLYVTTESDTTLSGPHAILAEFLVTENGLRLIYEVGGTMGTVHLRPSS